MLRALSFSCGWHVEIQRADCGWLQSRQQGTGHGQVTMCLVLLCLTVSTEWLCLRLCVFTRSVDRAHTCIQV